MNAWLAFALMVAGVAYGCVVGYQWGAFDCAHNINNACTEKYNVK